MECTCITHTDGKKEIRYGIDPIVNSKGIAIYSFANIPDEKIKEIEEATTDQVQTLLSKLF